MMSQSTERNWTGEDCRSEEIRFHCSCGPRSKSFSQVLYDSSLLATSTCPGSCDSVLEEARKLLRSIPSPSLIATWNKSPFPPLVHFRAESPDDFRVCNPRP